MFYGKLTSPAIWAMSPLPSQWVIWYMVTSPTKIITKTCSPLTVCMPLHIPSFWNLVSSHLFFKVHLNSARHPSLFLSDSTRPCAHCLAAGHTCQHGNHYVEALICVSSLSSHSSTTQPYKLTQGRPLSRGTGQWAHWTQTATGKAASWFSLTAAEFITSLWW